MEPDIRYGYAGHHWTSSPIPGQDLFNERTSNWQECTQLAVRARAPYWTWDSILKDCYVKKSKAGKTHDFAYSSISGNSACGSNHTKKKKDVLDEKTRQYLIDQLVRSVERAKPIF